MSGAKNDLNEKLILRRLEKVYCRIAPSKVHGVGIFAIRQIPVGTNPFNNSYQAQDAILINKHQIKNEEITRMLNDYHPSNGKQVLSAWPNQLIWSNYLNYDKENPNIQLMEDGEWRVLRTIEIGEELFENPDKLFNEDGTQKVFKVSSNQYPFIVKK